MLRKVTATLLALSGMMCFSIGLWADNHPTSLVVKTSTNKEHRYELQKIRKITFEGGKVLFANASSGKQFSPSEIALTEVSKIFFNNKGGANHSEILSERQPLAYRIEGNILTIDGLSEDDAILFVYATNGSLVAQLPIKTETISLDTTSWTKGVYFITTSLNHTLKVIL